MQFGHSYDTAKKRKYVDSERLRGKQGTQEIQGHFVRRNSVRERYACL